MQYTKRLKHLVKRIGDIEAIRYGKTINNRPRVENMSKLIEKVGFTFTTLCNDEKIDFEITNNSNIDKFVIDEDIFQSILINLLDNSRKHGFEYSQKGKKGVFTIELKVSNDNDFIYIEINDSGPGIKEESISEYLENDVPIPQEAGKKSGLGYGLKIVKEFVKNLGGQLNIVNKEDGGLRVSISIPFIVAVEDENGKNILL